jgi:hypothetical protein
LTESKYHEQISWTQTGFYYQKSFSSLFYGFFDFGIGYLFGASIGQTTCIGRVDLTNAIPK